MNPKLAELLKRIQTLHADLEALRPTLYDSDANALQTTLIHLLGEHKKLTVPKLAKLHQSSRQNIQVVMNELLTLGIVTTVTNPKHKSSKLFTLTTVGEAILEHNHKAYEAFLSQMDIEGDYDAALTLLEKLSKALHP